jgi:hypothetical protein
MVSQARLAVPEGECFTHLSLLPSVEVNLYMTEQSSISVGTGGAAIFPHAAEEPAKPKLISVANRRTLIVYR